MKALRPLSLVIIALALAAALTGCWSSHEVNQLAISDAVGIDKTAAGYLVTEQVVNPKAVASSKAVLETAVELYTAEGENIESTVKSFATQSGRAIYSMHLRVVVLGEEAARAGIDKIIEYFLRSNEYRTDFYFIVVKGGTAREALSILTPLDSLPGVSLYNAMNLSAEKWASSKRVRIIELVNAILADGQEPVMTALTISSGSLLSNDMEALQKSDAVKKLTLDGLGVFQGDQLVGWLNEEQSQGYNYITGGLKTTVGYTKSAGLGVAYEVVRCRSRIRAFLDQTGPSIEATIYLSYNIGAAEGSLDVAKDENKEKINKMVSDEVKRICEESLKKAKQELGADIFGFGEELRRTYPKYWQTVKDGWASEFSNLPVRVEVKAKLNSFGETRQPFYVEEKK